MSEPLKRHRKPGQKRRVRGGHHKPEPASGGRLRAFRLGEGLPPIPKMWAELLDMTDVLMGREPPPIEPAYLSLAEVADAYFARASELTMLIQAAERDGTVTRGSGYYKFRTGELRTFMEMAKRAADLGSRRLTADQLRFDMERYGRESRGFRESRYE